jgi:hypothetical protein
MKTKCEIRIFEIDQHAVVTLLDRLSDELSIVHFEGRLLLEKIEFSVVRAQAMIAIFQHLQSIFGRKRITHFFC